MNLQLSDLIWLSDKRKKLLLLLMDGPKSMKHIIKALNETAHSMSPQLKILKDEMLISQKEDMYELTTIGSIIVKNMYPLFNTLSVIDEDRKYWCGRDLSQIPQNFLERIGELGNYMLLDPGFFNIMDLPIEFTENLKKSAHIECLLSYYHPMYMKLYFSEAEAGKEMTFIFTENVFERALEEWESSLESAMKNEKIHIFLYPENTITGLPTICITESFLYLFLFRSDNNYENRRLMAFDDSARLWGAELFDYYMSLSVPVDTTSVRSGISCRRAILEVIDFLPSSAPFGD